MLTDIENTFSLTREFIADAAHELRTPLARLLVMLEGSLTEDLSTEEARELLDQAYHQCAHLRRLIDDLMFLARLDAGDVDSATQSFDLAASLDELEELWSAAGEQRGVAVMLTKPPAIPITGHPTLLRRVIVNLLDNAMRYTPEGGTVRVTAKNAATHVQITVSDSGDGIPTDEVPKVFDRFYRVDHSRNSGSGGTGLGLSICRKIVELHRGSIELTSMEGEGTSVQLCLPTEGDGNTQTRSRGSMELTDGT